MSVYLHTNTYGNAPRSCCFSVSGLGWKAFSFSSKVQHNKTLTSVMAMPCFFNCDMMGRITYHWRTMVALFSAFVFAIGCLIRLLAKGWRAVIHYTMGAQGVKICTEITTRTNTDNGPSDHKAANQTSFFCLPLPTDKLHLHPARLVQCVFFLLFELN